MKKIKFRKKIAKLGKNELGFRIPISLLNEFRYGKNYDVVVKEVEDDEVSGESQI